MDDLDVVISDVVVCFCVGAIVATVCPIVVGAIEWIAA